MADGHDQHDLDPRVGARADDAPAEEERAGRADAREQAEAILADSDDRQNGREESGGSVEHRVVTGEGPASDR